MNLYIPGFFFVTINPSKTMNLFFILIFGGKFKMLPTIGYIPLFDVLNKGTPSIPISNTTFPNSVLLNLRNKYCYHEYYIFV